MRLFHEGLDRMLNGRTLNRTEARLMMDHIMTGEANPHQISSFLTILRFRGETVDELTGFAESLRVHADHFDPGADVVDTCGTGGDGAATFNISTAVAILLSAAGVKVAKHGNRAVSSKSGSADALEALGIPVQASKEEALLFLKKHHMCFLFAPQYHSSMKYAAAVRKDLGFRTVFNILGPLANPAGSQRQLIGVPDFRVAKKMAEAVQTLGTKRTMIVTGDGGLDELAITGPSQALLIEDGKMKKLTIDPIELGLSRGSLDDIQVGTPSESAGLMLDVFHNRGNVSARNIVLLNGGAAFFVAGKAASIRDGIEIARVTLASGRALTHLEALRSKGQVLRHA
ncbi:anthranilate phosphoribosyltransferase [Camelliibacillus cellulosilyticus]|uniref:Anthranilate phosphoribosyltransferase n=1 Tax=Camelliibacillus cellulosilyticus TaxID=2174486 RepID=A0ABV9GKT9_9BACL